MIQIKQPVVIFPHIEKTAGTTIKWVLRNTFGIRHCDTMRSKTRIFDEKEFKRALQIFPFGLHSFAGHNLKAPTRFINGSDIFFFTVLRDPVQRSASFYQDNCLRGKMDISLEKWIQNPYRQNMQVKQIAGEENLDKAIDIIHKHYKLIGLTEELSLTLQLFKIMAPYPININYRKKIVARDNQIKKRILENPEYMRILEEYNNLDIQLFDYIRKELFPHYLKTYQDQLSKIPQPNLIKQSTNSLHYRTGQAYNKLIYRQINKIRGKGSFPTPIQNDQNS